MQRVCFHICLSFYYRALLFAPDLLMLSPAKRLKVCTTDLTRSTHDLAKWWTTRTRITKKNSGFLCHSPPDITKPISENLKLFPIVLKTSFSSPNFKENCQCQLSSIATFDGIGRFEFPAKVLAGTELCHYFHRNESQTKM